jgi:hypothetical protein
MPNIDLIPDVYYDPNHPYHYQFDNLPLKNIVIRQEIINSAVDVATAMILAAKGSTVSLAARLNVALEQDGTISSDTIDDSLHNIGAHTDGEYDGVEYVRMKQDERDKLENIADSAKNISIQIEDDVLSDGPVTFETSDTIEVELVSPSTIKLHTTFSTDALRVKYYNLTPVSQDLVPDYQNYFVNNLETAYAEGSLRVYVNGFRLSEDADVLVYLMAEGPTGTWIELSYTPDAEAGAFALSAPIGEDDIIRIDFDTEVA